MRTARSNGSPKGTIGWSVSWLRLRRVGRRSKDPQGEAELAVTPTKVIHLVLPVPPADLVEIRVIRLRALPETGRDRTADALLLALYGTLVFGGQAPVTAPALLKSARESGLVLKRASRALADKSRLVSTSGLRRGRRYWLTRAGIDHYEKLIPELLRLL